MKTRTAETKSSTPKWRFKITKKGAVIGLIGVLVIAAAAVYFGFSRPAKGSTGQNYMTVTAQKGTMEISVAASGTVSTANTQNIASQASGTVGDVFFQDGDWVNAGDVIAVIQDDAAKSDIEKLQSNLDKQMISYRKLEDSLEDLYIKTPVSGRVKLLEAKVGEDVGQTAKAYGSLAVISTEGTMKVSIKPENGITLEKGEPVNVTFNDGSAVDGTVLESGSNVVVEIPSDGFPIDAEVTVLTGSGMLVGKGILELSGFVNISGGSGVVDALYAKENSQVKRGDKLLKLDDSEVKVNMESMDIDIEQAKKDLEEKQAELENLAIKAPISGILTSLSVQAGDSLQKGKVVAAIVDTTQMEVTTAVDELDISKVKSGQKGIVRLDALPDKEFEGEVVKVNDIGKYTNGVTTYDVTLSIKDPQDIMIGMSANVEIQVVSKDNVILVPVEAVQSIGQNKFVMAAASSGNTANEQTGGNSGPHTGAGQQQWQRPGNGNFTGNRTRGAFPQTTSSSMAGSLRRVEVGLMNESYAEIVSGLSEGDQVMIPITNSSTSQQNNRTNFFGGFGGGGNMRMPSGGARNSTRN